ncbi:MAG: hypothetical protein BWY12_02245 [candidate division BRC1 bacterium ADurb.Bin183]|nr:MAG: hypothetical protein BWY12_02245 [candidate division BRC1 bacterium ADurb.Bin183]
MNKRIKKNYQSVYFLRRMTIIYSCVIVLSWAPITFEGLFFDGMRLFGIERINVFM